MMCFLVMDKAYFESFATYEITLFLFSFLDINFSVWALWILCKRVARLNRWNCFVFCNIKIMYVLLLLFTIVTGVSMSVYVVWNLMYEQKDFSQRVDVKLKFSIIHFVSSWRWIYIFLYAILPSKKFYAKQEWKKNEEIMACPIKLLC